MRNDRDIAAYAVRRHRAAIASETVAPGSAEEPTRGSSASSDFFGDLTESESVRELTKSTYSEDAFFNDTLKTVRGNEALEEYFLETAKNARNACAPPCGTWRSSDGNYYLRWVMDVEFAKLRKGRDRAHDRDHAGAVRAGRADRPAPGLSGIPPPASTSTFPSSGAPSGPSRAASNHPRLLKSDRHAFLGSYFRIHPTSSLA